MSKNEVVARSNRARNGVVEERVQVASRNRTKAEAGAASRVVQRVDREKDHEDDAEAVRAALLAQKQVELDKTIDKHDDMVRELFQMENFKNMLLYDPKVAKEDTTAVFREYKSTFDLVENSTPIAGPSRRTRGRVNEQRQIMTSSALSIPSRVSQSSKRAKSKIVDRPEIENILSTVSRGYKGKGKEREVPPQPLSDRAQHEEESVSTILVHRKRSPDARTGPEFSANEVIESISTPSKVNGKDRTPGLKRPAPVPINILELTENPSLLPQAEEHRPLSSASTPGISISAMKRREIRKPARSPTKLKPPASIVHTSPRSRENDSSLVSVPIKSPLAHLESSERFESQASLPPPVTFSPVTPERPHETISTRRNRWLRELPQPTLSPLKLNSVAPAPTPPSFSKIKRVKLIVRRPPPTLTDPRQRPPPPKFNNSLHAFLNSYTCIDDAEPFADPDKLAKQAREEAVIREKVEQFRIAGRFIPGTEVLFGTTPPDTPYTPPQRTTQDTWDYIVKEVVAQAKSRSRKLVGPTVAAQVASRVQSHFATKESRRTKARDVEERRLRNLAKSTMKMVIAEWKKAVYHIREKRRLQHEEEERREGRAHLASILDQSGQILETQHEDLSRGDMYGSRSRSGSIGDFDDNGDSDDEDGDEQTEEELDNDGIRDGDDSERTSYSVRSADDQDTDDDEEDDNGTSLLLAANGSSSLQPETALRSSASTPISAPEDFAAREDIETTGTSTANVTRSALNDLMMYADSDSEMDVEATLEIEPASSPVRVEAHISEQPSSPVPMQGPDSTLNFNDAYHRIESEIQEPDLDVNSAVDLPSSDSRSQSRGVRFAEAEPSTKEDSMDVDQGYPPGNENMGDSAPTSVQINGEDENTQDTDQDVEGEQLNEEHSELDDGTHETGETDLESRIPDYLKPYAVAPVEWDPEAKITPPLLLRGSLRPYQQSGLEWLASLHTNKLNGILADEMGLGKTIQTISLLAHLACDRGIWGPHLIIVPTSVLLNWEMEFKKFLPGFKVLSYHGSTKRRKDLRQGWNDKHQFNACITSYTLASRDAHIFKRKAWYYMILDEAHMIKNFKSQRWNILLMFRSYRRLLLTGTPLQNNLTELWALLQFLMSGANFANLKEFGEWFSNPLERAIESGNAHDEDTMQTVTKLHTVLRPYLLRRLKRDVEKELPSKFEHLTMCPLSKRQRFLYDEFMDRAQTRDALQSGVYQKIANILMQLRKVCNHPNLFEVRPIVTSFAMSRSAIADYEIKELLVRRQLLCDDDAVDLNAVGLDFINRQNVSLLSAVSTRYLDATPKLPHLTETAGEPPPKDTRTIDGYRKYTAYTKRLNRLSRWSYIGHLNKLRCSQIPIFSEEMLSVVRRMSTSIVPLSDLDLRQNYLERVDKVNAAVKSYATRAQELAPIINRFVFATPPVVALDLPRQVLIGYEHIVCQQPLEFDEIIHPVSVKLQIAFPDPSLLQWDCGKLQRLADLLRDKKAGGHRVLIFTQMTRILDVLEIFLNFHGYLYLRLDGATKIEDRQYITERFNADPRIFCFIASSRSGGVGINLTGADTVVFYDSDFNPQMDRQCEDRAHRIGQIRDVHIYRFVSQHTVEEAMLLKAEQKRSLDELVIQRGAFDWRALLTDASGEGGGVALARALGEYEDAEDRHAAAVAAREEFSLVGQDAADFADGEISGATELNAEAIDREAEDPNDEDEQGGSVAEYMLALVESDYDSFRDWRL